MDETPACQHRRTRLIAKDQDAEYVECLECGALLEAAEVPEASRTDSAGFDESLSDA
jgi:Zn ribbon nucleic-acid-binding protein